MDDQNKISIYEKLCNFSEKILHIRPTRGLEERLRESIEFLHLDISPIGSFSLAIFFAILSFAMSIILLIFRIISFGYVLFAGIIIALFAYYLINYPIHLSKVFRIKSGSEIVLSILYMVISMRSNPNIENAVAFASSNLKGPVGRDLKQLLWDVETGKYDNMGMALRKYSERWKRENEEFVKSIELILNSLYQPTAKRDIVLDEALDTILTGSSERMAKYARDLTLPITATYMLGILLPVLGMVLFPMLGIFLGELVKPLFLAIGYVIILPLFVTFFAMNSLDTRPITFFQVDISEHPEAVGANKFSIGVGTKKISIPAIVLALLISIPIFAVSFYLLPIPLPHTLYSVFMTIMFIVATATALIIYSYGETRKVIKIQREVETIETEFDETMFQLGYRIDRGTPLEKALEDTSQEIKQFKIRGLLLKSLNNIKNLGMTFEQSLFDKKYGALRYYPSRLIKTTMKVVSDSAKKGTKITALTMLTISRYLKGIHATQEKINDLLSEASSSLNFLAHFLVPVMCGIIVALGQLIMNILVTLSEKLEELTKISSLIGMNPLESIINLKQATSPEVLQIIIGIYMVELSMIFAYFISGINKGPSKVEILNKAIKILLFSTLVYVTSYLLIGSIFGGIIGSISMLGGY